MWMTGMKSEVFKFIYKIHHFLNRLDDTFNKTFISYNIRNEKILAKADDPNGIYVSISELSPKKFSKKVLIIILEDSVIVNTIDYKHKVTIKYSGSNLCNSAMSNISNFLEMENIYE